ncbi:hypothetical protein DEH69_21260 [Streptomyces sp. PT12]|nr:hypothetical protein DEH69_21260 [Streptomyces sp. PT12]
MSDEARAQRETLGARLRGLRKDAGYSSGRAFAAVTGWQESKVSRLENGRQNASEEDIRVWCEKTGAGEHIPDLIATVRHIEELWSEWRRQLQSGAAPRQRKALPVYARTRVFRIWHPTVVWGTFQNAEYATETFRQVVEYDEIPDDVDAAVGKRMERQQYLYQARPRVGQRTPAAPDGPRPARGRPGHGRGRLRRGRDAAGPADRRARGGGGRGGLPLSDVRRAGRRLALGRARHRDRLARRRPRPPRADADRRGRGPRAPRTAPRALRRRGRPARSPARRARRLCRERPQRVPARRRRRGVAGSRGHGAPTFPGVDAPTLHEVGLDMEFTNWRGLLVPPGLAAEARERLMALLTRLHGTREWRGALRDNGWPDAFLTGERFARFLAEETRRVNDLCRRFLGK